MVYVIGTHKQISFNCSKSHMVGSFRLTDEYTCHWQEGSDIWKSNKYVFLTIQQPCTMTLKEDRRPQEKMQACLY